MSYLKYAYPEQKKFNLMPNFSAVNSAPLSFPALSGISGTKGPFDEQLNSLNFKGKNGYVINEEIDEGENKICSISSTIYLWTDSLIDLTTIEYCEYFEENIESIWNDLRFKNDDDDDDDILTKTNVIVRLMSEAESTIKSDKIIPLKTDFAEGDIVLYLQDDLNRSFIREDKRTGVMNVNDNSRNTPAHEFGHILGLSDRYHYFHFYARGEVKHPEQNIFNDYGEGHGIDRPIEVVSSGILKKLNGEDRHAGQLIEHGTSVAMYAPFKEGDEEYGNNRAWVDNLMSFGGKHLTSFQLNLVCKQQQEKSYNQFSFFVPALTPKSIIDNRKSPGITPSFIGIKGDSYVLDVNNEAQKMDINNPEQIKFMNYGHFNPTMGQNIIRKNDYYKNGDLYKENLKKLSYGGRSRGEVLDSVLEIPKNLEKIRNRRNTIIGRCVDVPQGTKTITIYGSGGSLPQFNVNLRDKFSTIGFGNTVGYNIWNNFFDRRLRHVETIQPKNRTNGTTPRTKNLELFRINNVNFYHNRKRILEMYLLAN